MDEHTPEDLWLRWETLQTSQLITSSWSQNHASSQCVYIWWLSGCWVTQACAQPNCRLEKGKCLFLNWLYKILSRRLPHYNLLSHHGPSPFQRVHHPSSPPPSKHSYLCLATLTSLAWKKEGDASTNQEWTQKRENLTVDLIFVLTFVHSSAVQMVLRSYRPAHLSCLILHYHCFFPPPPLPSVSRYSRL